MSGETGIASFVSSLTTGLSAEAVWGAIAPVAPLIIVLTIVAVVRRVLNKNLSATKTGKSGRV